MRSRPVERQEDASGAWALGQEGSAQQGGATRLPDGAPVGQERGRRQGSVRGLGWQQ